MWKGYYLDGKTAARQRAAISLQPDGLCITTENGKKVVWPYMQICQTQGSYEGEQVRLERGSEFPEILLVEEAGFLAAMHQRAPKLTGHVHDPGRRTLRANLTILAALAAVCLLAVQYWWGIPGMAALIAPQVPVAWEERLGQSVIETLSSEQSLCTNPQTLQAISEITTRLLPTIPNNPYKFKIVVENKRAINAFAVPGGYVVVFRGLLEKTRTPEELAGVLAHEIQHVLRHHTTRSILEHASTGILLAALTGDLSSAMSFGMDGARTLGILQYSRSHEEEADAEGMKTLIAAGIDPGEMVAFYGLMKDEEKIRGQNNGLSAYLSTHPRTEDRIKDLAALAKGLMTQPSSSLQPLLPNVDWRAIRIQCQPQSTEKVQAIK